jgi:hypothetical protein
MTPDATAAAGRALWRCLHAYADTYPGAPTPADRQRARMWLRAWAAAVPREGCNCHGGWGEVLFLTPPPLESRDAFQGWTIAVHDAINAKLARALYHPRISEPHPVYQRLVEHWRVSVPARPGG